MIIKKIRTNSAEFFCNRLKSNIKKSKIYCGLNGATDVND